MIYTTLLISKEGIRSLILTNQSILSNDLSILAKPDFLIQTEEGNFIYSRKYSTEAAIFANIIFKSIKEIVGEENLIMMMTVNSNTEIHGILKDSQYPVGSLLTKHISFHANYSIEEHLEYNDIILEITNDDEQRLQISEVDDDVSGFIEVQDEDGVAIYNFNVPEAYKIRDAMDTFLLKNVKDHKKI